MAASGAGTGPDEGSGQQTVATGGPVRRALFAFRRWRRTRPFWGGLLVVLGGAEILLSEKAPLPVIIHIGLQGLAGYLVPAILVLCGLLLVFHPVQQTFYALLAILLSLGSWITSNLGGFFVGMLLGLIGGSLAFAWVRSAHPGPAPPEPRERPEKPPSAGLSLILRDPETGTPAENGAGTAPSAPRTDADGDTPHGAGRHGSVLLTISAIPALLVVFLAFPRQLPQRGLPQLASARELTVSPTAPAPSLVPTPTPSPTPSLTATPTASTSPAPTPSTTGTPISTPTATPTRTPTASVSPTPAPSHRARRRHVRARPSGLTATVVVSTIAAQTLAFSEVSFDGVATLRTAQGVVPMLKFRMNAMTFAGRATLTVQRHSVPLVTTGSSFGFTGHVVLYTTKLSGELNGVKVTFTPKSPPQHVRRNMVFTGVVIHQPYAISDSLQAVGLTMVGM